MCSSSRDRKTKTICKKCHKLSYIQDIVQCQLACLESNVGRQLDDVQHPVQDS